MSVERPSFGIVPTHIISCDEDGGQVFETKQLIADYRANGYDAGKVAEKAYLLAEERRAQGDPRGYDNDRNWEDAERIVSIEHSLRPETEKEVTSAA